MAMNTKIKITRTKTMAKTMIVKKATTKAI